MTRPRRKSLPRNSPNAPSDRGEREAKSRIFRNDLVARSVVSDLERVRPLGLRQIPTAPMEPVADVLLAFEKHARLPAPQVNRGGPGFWDLRLSWRAAAPFDRRSER